MPCVSQKFWDHFKVYEDSKDFSTCNWKCIHVPEASNVGYFRIKLYFAINFQIVSIKHIILKLMNYGW